MKKSILGLVAASALIAGPAMAADLRMPVKAPYAPPPAPVVSWTGCYIDGGVGYGFFNQKHNLNSTVAPVGPLTTSSNTGGEGWLGRLGGGCDYQFGSSWVIGAFGDYDFTNLKGTFSDGGIGGSEKETGAWHVGGRLGYLVTPSLLGYVSGGYTQARFDQINLSQQFIPVLGLGETIPAHTYNGWFIGGGTEYALSGIIPISGLFWRTEYRYDSYQSADLPIVSATGASAGLSAHMQKNVQTVTSGLVWRFNFGGPVGPRY